ncbi:MAG: methionine adenosyltransferase [Clostridia bacterium]|nr:methionine adenosyltransferase [Clostridia bacterium]
MLYRIFTSESPAEGHPDKVCDAVSDAVLDAYLSVDPKAHVACETCATTGMLCVMGEITADSPVDVQAIARKTVLDIGYDSDAKGFNANTCAVLNPLDRQSPDINMGVVSSVESKSSDDKYDTIGAGDQGMMFGFACTETPELMPAPIWYAHKLTRRLSEVRKSGLLPFVYPDGKAQITITYGENGPEAINSVVVSTQHSDDVSIETLREAIMEEVIAKVVPAELCSSATEYFINPTGRFVVGGPMGDTGLTGRKIIADTYGGYVKHGGGAFSGKDPTKVDRSAAYMARYAAKNIVAAGLADACEIAVAYAIGVSHPLMLTASTFGTGKMSDEKLSKLVGEFFDFRPAAIIEKLDLCRPIYRGTASFGHFGREELDLPWEKTDKAEELAALVL